MEEDEKVEICLKVIYTKSIDKNNLEEDSLLIAEAIANGDDQLLMEYFEDSNIVYKYSINKEYPNSLGGG